MLIPRLCCLGSHGGEGGIAAEWSCAPAVPPIRSVFQSGMRCSMVLMTVLASCGKGGIEAEVHPAAEGDMVVRASDEEAPVSDRYDGPQTVRAGPRSDPNR